ncbi:MAG: hypothetical protein K2H46_02635 [Muribaculaceae bacterium]|nr:hypothetical protein [Muribaculaceae bacterium]
MTTYNGYEYNEFGVCLNPDKPYQFGKDHYYYFTIEVSESPKGWTYGYQWSCGTSGGGSPCSPTWKTFPCRSKAIVACARLLKKNFTGNRGQHFRAELDRIIAEESGKKPHLKQYSIFDYLND